MDTARTTWQHTLRDRARRNASDRGVRSIQEPTSVPDPYIPKGDRGEGTRWKSPLPTRPEKRNPGWRSSTDPWEGRTAVRTNASRSPQRQPEAVTLHEDQKQTQPKEGKQRYDRVLRNNTDRTWDRWPNMKTRNTTGPRNPEAQQCHEGKPTRTWQRTRVTTSTAKLRREDNQGETSITSSHQQTLEARGKNPR